MDLGKRRNISRLGRSAAALALAFALTGNPALGQEAASSAPETVNAQTQQIRDQMLKYGNGNYLAFVRSSSPALNLNAGRALRALRREVEKTASLDLEEEVVDVDIEKQTLKPFQFVYWPIGPDEATISLEAQAEVQAFLNRGGLIVFDVQDRGAAADPAEAVQKVIGSVNLGPLVDLPKNHTLTRTFYNVSDLRGSINLEKVQIQAPDSSRSEDVSRVIIGRRDWARAWAGTSLTAEDHEQALYGAVNAVVYAYTGDYKGHQLRVNQTLERINNQ